MEVMDEVMDEVREGVRGRESVESQTGRRGEALSEVTCTVGWVLVRYGEGRGVPSPGCESESERCHLLVGMGWGGRGKRGDEAL